MGLVSCAGSNGANQADFQLLKKTFVLLTEFILFRVIIDNFLLHPVRKFVLLFMLFTL